MSSAQSANELATARGIVGLSDGSASSRRPPPSERFKANLTDANETLPVCAADRSVRLSDLFLGVPASSAVKESSNREWDLTPEELDELHAAAKIVQERVTTLPV